MTKDTTRPGPRSFAELRRSLAAHGYTPDANPELYSDLGSLEEYLERDRKRTRQQARIDELTGLLRAEHFKKGLLPKYIRERASEKRGHPESIDPSIHERRSEWAGLSFIDLDDFKPINDIHGHRVGDKVLKHVAEILRLNVRTRETYIGRSTHEVGFIGRLGGDEFGVLETSLRRWTDAFFASDRYRQRIFDYPWGTVDPRLDLTRPGASVGVAILRLESLLGYASEADAIAEQWLHVADLLMYRVKEERLSQVLHKGIEWNGKELVEIELPSAIRLVQSLDA